MYAKLPERRVERRQRRLALLPLAARAHLRDAEVEDARPLLALVGGDLAGRELALLDEEVRRLDVAVDDPRLVRGVEPLERVVDDRGDLGERQVLLAAQPLVEPLAREQLEGDPQAAVPVLARRPGWSRRAGDLICAAMAASRWKRATRSVSCAALSCRTLMATFSPLLLSAA